MRLSARPYPEIIVRCIDLIDEIPVIIRLAKDILERHLRTLAAGLVVCTVFGLFVLGAAPVAVGLIPAPWDKLAHACVYGLMAAAIGLASGLRGWRMVLTALVSVILVGVLDEWHQMSLPGRLPGWDDLLADGIGGLLGVAVLGWRRRAVRL